jgi:hypothetical protein
VEVVVGLWKFLLNTSMAGFFLLRFVAPLLTLSTTYQGLEKFP